MKKGFSLMTAIVFIVAVATISALSLSMSNVSRKQLGDIYLISQANLLAKSATEFAIMGVTAHKIDTASGCLNKIDVTFPTNGEDKLFDINVTISYFGNGLPAGCNILDNYLATPDLNLTIMIDTFVTSASNVSSEPIRIHRRTLQRP